MTGLAVAGLSATTQAAFVPLPILPTYEDNNLEYLSRLNPETQEYEIIQRDNFDGTGPLVVGDRLTAVISFDAVRDRDGNAIFTNLGQPGLEVTGISEIEVKGFFTDGIGNNRITWGPSAAFEAAYGSGAMAALFSQANGNFDVGCSSASIATCVDPATDGDDYLVAGFADADDYWSSTGAGVTVDFAANFPASDPFGQANFALSLLENNTGYDFVQMLNLSNLAFNEAALLAGDCVDDCFVDLIGGGQLLGGTGLLGPWFARSDFDFDLQRVPVPAPVALLGLGLLGLGTMRSFKKRSKA